LHTGRASAGRTPPPGACAWHETEAWRARRYSTGANEHLWGGARGAEPTTSVPPTSKETPAAPAPAPAALFAPERLDLLTLGMGALLLFVIAGGLGWWLGGRDASGVITRLQGELVKSQQEGARLAVAQLDADLVTVPRAALGDEARGPLDDTQAHLAEATAALAAGGTDARTEALAKLEAARAALARLRDGRATGRRILARIENATRLGPDQG